MATGKPARLKNARYALWKNPDNLTDRQRDKLAWIAKTDPRLHRAYLLKEGLRYVFAVKGEAGKHALGPMAVLGPPLPHPRLRQPRQTHRRRPRAHRRHPRARPVQRADRIGQHQDPTDHPHRVRLPLSRRPDRTRDAQPRRPPTRHSPADQTHGSVSRAAFSGVMGAPEAIQTGRSWLAASLFTSTRAATARSRLYGGPMASVKQFQVTFDCAEPERVARFWCEVLGYVVPPPPEGFATWDDFDRALPPERQGSAFACVDPSGVGPRLFFQRVPEGKVVKNRLHLDVRVGTGLVGEERLAALEAECARLVALGAVRVRLLPADGYNESCLVMQDIEGNEFCLD